MRPTVPPYDHDHENEVVLFGATNFRNQMRKFGIKTDDRRRHTYVIGKTGMGKTTLMENMVLADIYAGHGVAYVDPHGDTAQKLLDFIPSHRINDVIYFNPSDMSFPIGFNILETVDESHKHLVAAGLMGVFKKIWPDVWSARMEYILLNSVLALLDAPGSTLLGINRLLVDPEYRKKVVSLIQDPVVKTFWVKEFAAFSEKYRTEAIAPVQNKVGQFLSAAIIRNIVAQVKSTIDLREIMDTRKIFILNLSKGLIGEENARLLGAMIITRLQLAAMERVDMPEEDRQDFYLYVDEFQNFATESFANILSEARKYRLNLTVAHQYIEQLDELVRAAVFGNVGTLICFRVGAADATFMEQEFTPRFTPEDLVNLKKFEVYLKLMIDGAASEPFSANTLPPIAQRTGNAEKVIKVSRERYAKPRKEIEDKVIRWSGLGTTDEGGIIDVADEDEAEIVEKMKALEASSPDVGEMAKPADGGFGGAKKKPKKTYTIPCAVCGKPQELTFEPDWSRPWFCKDDLDKKDKIKFPPTGRPPGAAAPPASERPPAAPPPPSMVKPAVTVSDDVAPVPLSALAEKPRAAAPPSLPPRSAPPPPQRRDDAPRPEARPRRDQDDASADGRKKRRRKKGKGVQEGGSPPRPPFLPPPGAKLDGPGIPMQSHKPRIVIGGDEPERLAPPEKPVQGESGARGVEEASARPDVQNDRPKRDDRARRDERPRHERPLDRAARQDQPPARDAAPHPQPPRPRPIPPEEPPKRDDGASGAKTSIKPGQVIKF